ncbi:DUF2231 domain-containing protein [Algoriphagus persicinus]|uniref:DUF2231 domain-containing protein n=1 Tax=Algoriphagus persicinus TaxID=3108754 RepID=UPI002B3A58B1|nr:DUF2231 domain-containing protein [Algoriphagus sp. E1-3-M2]MEB2787215.1 DUF2231 domain-containing protein [Algoriphagus sp. E1-3-M2]
MEALLPEWAPNIHPLIIHFPIALWLAAVFFDLISLISKDAWIRNTAMALYGLGALSAYAAFLSGDQAIDMVTIPFQGEVTASNHSDWGSYTLYFFIAYTIVRGVIFWKQWDKKKIVAIVLFILGTIGTGMVAKTADLGGKLVYKYGVGINK